MVRVRLAKFFWSRMRAVELGEVLAGPFLDQRPPEIDALVPMARRLLPVSASRTIRPTTSASGTSSRVLRPA